jgi:ABC-type multidrug transport system ATPase subunit
MIVIASIHQPATATYNLFSQVILLTSGSTVYAGPTSNAVAYFGGAGITFPPMMNPAEYMLDFCNVDFDGEGLQDGGEDRKARLDRLISFWANSREKGSETDTESGSVDASSIEDDGAVEMVQSRTGVLKQTWILLSRLWLKSYRDLLAYWIRVAMYLGIPLLTLWSRICQC